MGTARLQSSVGVVLVWLHLVLACQLILCEETEVALQIGVVCYRSLAGVSHGCWVPALVDINILGCSYYKTVVLGCLATESSRRGLRSHISLSSTISSIRANMWDSRTE